MIIKSKSIKSKKALQNSLRYILSKEDEKDIGFVLSRFIRGDRPFEALLEKAEHDMEKQMIWLEKRVENMFDQFVGNNDKRKIKRKNANLASHEIISFHKNDTKNLPPETLLNIARKYAKERSPNSIVVSTMHSDKDHLHIHQILSAVEFATGKSARLSKKEFHQVKERMELWQQKELGLEFSNVQHSKKKELALLKDAEYQLNLKGKQSEKQKFQLKIAEVFGSSPNSIKFFKSLEKEGLQLYERGGSIAGIQGEKRRYRLKTLGYSKERIQEIENSKDNRLDSLKSLRSEKENHIDPER
jgi:hypothetical protein